MRFPYLILALLLALIPAVGAAQDKRCKLVDYAISFIELSFYSKDELVREYCVSIQDGVKFLNLAEDSNSAEGERQSLVDGVACYRFAETARLLLEKDHNLTSLELSDHCRPLWSQICKPEAAAVGQSCIPPYREGIDTLSSYSRAFPIQLPGYGRDDPPIPACWAQYTLLQLKLRELFERDNGWNQEIVGTAKAQLRSLLEAQDTTCPDYAEFYSLPADRLLKTSLIDIAVLADSSEFILSRRDLVLDGIERGQDELEYFGIFVHWAAYFESHNSMKALAEIGVDLSANDNRGVSPLHVANARTTAGLQNLVFLTENGVDVNEKVDRKLTPLLVSYLMQDLDKAMCLRELGAQEPSFEEYSKFAEGSEKGAYFEDEAFEIREQDLILGAREIERICSK